MKLFVCVYTGAFLPFPNTLALEKPNKQGNFYIIYPHGYSSGKYVSVNVKYFKIETL